MKAKQAPRSISSLRTALLGLLLLTGSGSLLPLQPRPSREYALTVVMLGSWKGNFLPDQRGEGGLAALHTWTERLRRRAKVEGGSVLLLHGGEFTSAKSAGQFSEQIFRKELNLITYMKFDAFSFSSLENGWIEKLQGRDLDTLPALSFNKTNRIRKTTQGRAVIAPYRILARGEYTVYLTSLTPSSPKGKEYDASSLVALRKELKRQTGTDLNIIFTAPPEKGETISEQDHFERELFQFPGMSQTSINLPIASTLPSRTLILEAESKENRFRRLPSGAYLCALRQKQICKITFRFRNHQIIGVDQEFPQINGNTSPWTPQDPYLTRILSTDKNPTP